MQFCAEDHKWWWRCFWNSGGCAFYIFAYATFYFFTKLEVTDPVPILVYFSYSAVMSIAFFFMTGTIGFAATFIFTQRIYGAVKID
jgi:transmembrane 9 superfamily protein 2/4